MALSFTWDSDKEQINIRKHGIDFTTASEVFDDPNQIVLENYLFSEEGEQRYQIIGLTNGLLVLSVVFVDRSDEQNEVIRIINARKANAYEIELYESTQS
jgi:uncharacterized DUF497 family protein